MYSSNLKGFFFRKGGNEVEKRTELIAIAPKAAPGRQHSCTRILHVRVPLSVSLLPKKIIILNGHYLCVSFDKIKYSFKHHLPGDFNFSVASSEILEQYLVEHL